MKSAVIYRFNHDLANRVAKTKPDFVHEFPAECSIEDIQKEMSTILEKAYDNLKDDSDRQIHIDGTVFSALGNEGQIEARKRFYIRLIRQDDVSAYDKYAEKVVEKTRQGFYDFFIIQDRIADHNSEVTDPENYDQSGVSRMDAECKAVHNWVDRLKKHKVRATVVSARDFELGLKYGSISFHKAVVVCDHHNGPGLKKLIVEKGGTWFNAFPPYSDSEL